MNAVAAIVRARRRRTILVAAVLAIAALAAALSQAGPASACAPVPNCLLPNGAYEFTVPLSGAAQSATGLPGDPSASGTADIMLEEGINQVCSTTSWSGTSSPVAAGHVHAGASGQPENPAVTISLFNPNPLGVSSPASGCQIVPTPVMQEIVKCPAQFNVVVHTQNRPWGALRGQLGSTCTLP